MGIFSGKTKADPVGSEAHLGRNTEQLDVEMASDVNTTPDVQGDDMNRMEATPPGVVLHPPMPHHFDARLHFRFTRFLEFQSRTARGQTSAFDFVRFLEHENAGIAHEAQTAAAHCAFLQSEMARVSGQHQQEVSALESGLRDKIQELSASKNIVSEELADAKAQLGVTKSKLASMESELQDRNKALQRTKVDWDNEKEKNKSCAGKLDSVQKDLNARKLDLENKLRASESATQAKDQVVQRLKCLVQEKEKEFGNLQSSIAVLTTEHDKLKGQLSAIEQKAAQDSLLSGSYADGQANPDSLMRACQDVDTATESWVRFLYDNSIKGKISLKSQEMEIFLRSLSRASPEDFPRLLQVKYAWAHWICAKMFKGFQDTFFDVGEERATPLDSRKHASECFRSYQEMRGLTSEQLHDRSDLFRAYGIKMYSLLTNDELVWTHTVTCDLLESSRFGEEMSRHFSEVAKAIWLLHELAFSFSPPASILRTGWGEPFDREFHEEVVKGDSDVISSKIVLMTRPGFRLKNSIVKSKVFLSQKP